jgi:hypothetical protein
MTTLTQYSRANPRHISLGKIPRLLLMGEIIRIVVIKLLLLFFVKIVQRPVLETANYALIGDFQ